MMLQLKKIFKDGHYYIDTNVEGKVEVAIVLPSEQKVTEHRKKGDGSFMWVKTETNKGEIYVGSVYAPNNRRQRCNLWKWMR